MSKRKQIKRGCKFTSADEASTDFASTLPSELLTEIFSYLQPLELRNVSVVCKWWYEVSRNPVLWKSLELCIKSSKQLWLCCELLERCTMIRKLKVERGSEFDRFWINCPSLPSLRELTVTNNYLVNEPNIAIIVSKCLFLEKLDLTGCTKVTIRSMKHITSLQNLRTLILSGCKRVNDECIVTVAKGLCNLEHIDMNEISGLSAVSFRALAKYHSESLRCICMASTETGQTYPVLFAIIECKKLTSLVIGESLFTEDKIKALGRVLMMPAFGRSRNS